MRVPGFKQRGTTTVEFAIVGSLVILTLLTVLEFSRALFVMNALGEATRRGARMAAVCPINDPAVARTAVFSTGGGSDSPIVANLNTGNVVLEYLDSTGNVLGDPVGSFIQIRYVRVRIANFQHRFLLPFFDVEFTTPGFASVLPRESLGIPREGAITPC